MIKERGHDQRPAVAEDPHQPPASALLAGRTGHGGKRRGREVRFGRAPTASNHHVALGIANHRRSTRTGSVTRVDCHCHPPRLNLNRPGFLGGSNI